MMKVIILGASIAGSAMALVLSKSYDVSVYDARRRNEIPEKVCGNLCTHSMDKFVKRLGLGENFKVSHYDKINIFSKNHRAEFPTDEYEIDRRKLLAGLGGLAEKNGAQFHFSTRFLDVRRRKSNHEVFLERNGKIFSDKADIIIGADGAVSGVAKSINRSNKKFFLFLQTRVRAGLISRKDLLPERNSYSVFLGKKYGYYAYIFPSSDGREMKIGLGGDFESDVSGKFQGFLKSLGVKNAKVTGALVPKPTVNRGEGKVLLVGDASGNVKYSAGGIVPILEQALALEDKLLNQKSGGLQRLDRKIRFNGLIQKLISKMNDRDFDDVLEILGDRKFREVFSSRDDMGAREIMTLISPGLLFLGTKILLRR